MYLALIRCQTVWGWGFEANRFSELPQTVLYLVANSRGQRARSPGRWAAAIICQFKKLMREELNKNVLRGEPRERERRGEGEREGERKSSRPPFFPTQPSSPDVYGLYKLLRARRMSPTLMWAAAREPRRTVTLPLSFSLSPSLSLSVCLDSLVAYPSRHTTAGKQNYCYSQKSLSHDRRARPRKRIHILFPKIVVSILFYSRIYFIDLLKKCLYVVYSPYSHTPPPSPPSPSAPPPMCCVLLDPASRHLRFSCSALFPAHVVSNRPTWVR